MGVKPLQVDHYSPSSIDLELRAPFSAGKNAVGMFRMTCLALWCSPFIRAGRVFSIAQVLGVKGRLRTHASDIRRPRAGQGAFVTRDCDAGRPNRAPRSLRRLNSLPRCAGLMRRLCWCSGIRLSEGNPHA